MINTCHGALYAGVRGYCIVVCCLAVGQDVFRVSMLDPRHRSPLRYSFATCLKHHGTCACTCLTPQVGLTDKVPFLLEAKLIELGADFSKVDPWTPYAVVDGRVVTGQNPMSSELTAQKVVEVLQASA